MVDDVSLEPKPEPKLEVIQGGRSANAPQRVGDFTVPYGYELWADGTYKVGEGPSPEPGEPSILRTPPPKHRAWLDQVASRPIWVTQQADALDSKEELFELAAIAAKGGVITAWESRGNLADGRRIVACLAKKGFPVRAGNAAQVERYLDKAIHTNAATLPVRQAAARTGAYEVQTTRTELVDGALAVVREESIGWLLGEQWIGPPGTTVYADHRRAASWTRGFTARGTLSEWLAGFEVLNTAGPLVRWLTATAFAAPLLRLVGHRTFLVHHWGPSGTGKSTLLRFAMSVVGDPQLLVAHHNRTEKSYAEVFTYISDVLVAFDELQAADGKSAAPLAYTLGAERGRARAQATGGLEEETADWHAIVRMTGEEPSIGRGRLNLGGEGARVIEIGRAALDEADAKQLNLWMARGAYGVAGPMFLRWLVDQGYTGLASREALTGLYRWLTDRLVALEPTCAAHGRAAHLAVVALGQALAACALLGTSLERALDQALEDGCAVAAILAEEESAHASVAARAIQLFVDHLLSRRFEWANLAEAADRYKLAAGGTGRPLFGVIAGDELWLIQGPANHFLLKEGLPPRRVWADLAERGVLAVERGSQALRRDLVGRDVRVYVLRRDQMR